MPLFEQEFLRAGRYHVGGGRYRTITRDDLRSYLDNTLALMRQGYGIPVLARHAAPGSVDGGPLLLSHRDRRTRLSDARANVSGAAQRDRDSLRTHHVYLHHR